MIPKVRNNESCRSTHTCCFVAIPPLRRQSQSQTIGWSTHTYKHTYTHPHTSMALMFTKDSSLFTKRHSPHVRSLTSLYDITKLQVPVDVLGPSDIVYGSLIALVLGLTASFLQGMRNRDDFAPSDTLSVQTLNTNTNASTTLSTTTTTALGSDENDDDSSLLLNSNKNERIVFDADSWKEMSDPESYVFYNQKLKQRKAKSKSKQKLLNIKPENAWVLVSLLILFVPIFSVEFFFATSRQFLCGGGDPLNQSDWSAFLCSPVYVPVRD